MSSDQPNVVLICADQWRGDALSIDGHPVVRTPYLDQLATQGARFTNAYSATPSCVPARMALMTGLSQRSHGRVGYQDGIEFDIETTLPGQFRANGYQTQAIGKMHYAPTRARIGFDDVRLHDGYLHINRRRDRSIDFTDDYLVWLRHQAGESAVSDYADNGLHCNSVVARPWDKAEILHPTNWAVTEAISWLYRRDPRVPFFLYLSFHRPHAPLDPPAWAFDQYMEKPDRDVPVGNWIDLFESRRQDNRPDALAAQYPTDIVRRAHAGYYGHLSHIDQQINRFLGSLQEFGLRHNTIVAFVSDHGDMMGDHHLWRKNTPYEGSAKIPFLLSGPEIPWGTVCDNVVELRDLMPTLLDYAGLPIPDCVQGRSTRPLVDKTGSQWREYLHGEHVVWPGSLQWIRFDDWKYIWHSDTGSEQLFFLADDPDERVDLTRMSLREDSRQALTYARDRLIEELTGREEGYVANGALIVGRTPQNLLTTSRRR